VRVHGRDLARLEVYGEDADVIVFENYLMRVAGDFGNVLRGSGARGGVDRGGEKERSAEDGSRESHGDLLEAVG